MAEYIEREYTCGDCIHADLCERITFIDEFSRDNIAYCKGFKATADVVEVVRCKDCKNWNNGYCCGVPLVGDDASYVATEETDYCSYGKAKMDGKDDG